MAKKQGTKLCKHCKTKIPAGAKVCPNCRKKQGYILKWVIIGIVVIGIIGSAGESDDNAKDVTTAKKENLENTSSQEKKKETEFSVGETAEYKNVQVKLIGYEESYGNDWGKPGDGKVFVFPEFEITNNSNEEISVSSLVSFECYVDDYKTDFSSNAFMVISTEDGKQQLDGSIAPGKKLKGVLGIEASSNWNTVEIYYKDNVWLNSNFSFEIRR